MINQKLGNPGKKILCHEENRTKSEMNGSRYPEKNDSSTLCMYPITVRDRIKLENKCTIFTPSCCLRQLNVIDTLIATSYENVTLFWLSQIPVLNGSTQFLILYDRYTTTPIEHNCTFNGPDGTRCTLAPCPGYSKFRFCHSFVWKSSLCIYPCT